VPIAVDKAAPAFMLLGNPAESVCTPPLLLLWPCCTPKPNIWATCGLNCADFCIAAAGFAVDVCVDGGIAGASTGCALLAFPGTTAALFRAAWLRGIRNGVNTRQIVAKKTTARRAFILILLRVNNPRKHQPRMAGHLQIEPLVLPLGSARLN